MNNYKVEDGFDFYAAIDTENDDSKGVSETECLLSSAPLDYTAVVLPCGHSFNYAPLYREVVQQKKSFSSLETVKLGYSQFKCPYCRTIHSHLLPFIELKGISCIRGVNTTSDNALNLFPCDWIMREGKRKGEICGKKCHVLLAESRSCVRHANKKRKLLLIVSICGAILKTGARRGQKCGARVRGTDSVSQCKRHMSKN